MSGPLNLPQINVDEDTAVILEQAVGYAESVLEDAQLPWPVEVASRVTRGGAVLTPYSGDSDVITHSVTGALQALSVDEATKIMEWAQERIARAWVVGYAASIDQEGDRKARRLRRKGRAK